MNTPRALRLSTLSASSLLALAGVCSSAQAQCLDVYRTSLPDLDQRREAADGILGLPWNGSVHCVPTSWADNIAFLSNHGLPGLTLNVQYDWKAPETYNISGFLIYILGNLMGTDSGGTSNSVSGLKEFFNQRAPGALVGGGKSYSDIDPPCPKDLRELLLCGGFGAVTRGTYQYPENTVQLNRTGGHILALRGVHDICSAPNISLRDPNTSDSRFTQDIFSTYKEPLAKGTFTFLVDGILTDRTVWYWTTTSTSTKKKVFDGFASVIPTVSISGKPVVGNEPSGLAIVRPLNLTDPIHPTHTGPQMPPGTGQIRGLHIDPSLAWCWVLADGPGGTTRLIQVGMGSGDTELKYELANTLISSVVTHTGQVIAATAAGLSKFSRNADGATLQVQFARASAPTLDMAEDDTTGELVLLRGTPSAPTMCRRPLNLAQPEGPTNPCPPGVLFNGTISMACNPTSGEVLCCSSGVPSIFRLGRNAAGGPVLLESIALPAGSNPGNLNWSDTGSILFTSGGVLRDYERPAGGGAWQPKGNSYHAGRLVPGGQKVVVPVSRPASDRPSDVAGDARNILDERLANIPDTCSADFNGDGDIGTDQDIEAFFRCLAGNCCATCLANGADFNGDGDIGTDQDIEAFFRVLAGGAC